MDTIPIETDYVIIPDAGSMQFDEQEEISKSGKKAIIIDHHNIQNPPKFNNIILVNNQSSEKFKNKALSGAGVVYKLIQGFNEYYGDEFESIYRDYTDLAALGIIADMMDTRTLDNNFIISTGLNNVHNPMLRALLEKQQFSIERSGGDIESPTKINMAFYVAPLINAVIRFGTPEEKEELFKGFITERATEIVETTYRGEIRKENFYDYVARISSNVRARQNREKEKSMEFISKRVEEENLTNNQLIIVKVSKDDDVVVPKTITGLVAMEVLKKYKKPVLILRPKMVDGKVAYAGSGRGKANGDFDSLFGLLRESGYCNYVEGHDMAHGVEIYEENIDKVIDFANKKLADIQFDVDEVEVDYEFTNSNINRDMIMQFGKVLNIYGNGIPQPKFGFRLNLASSSIRIIGKKENTISLSADGLDLIKFGADDIIKTIKENPSNLYEFKVVGRAQINEWMGKSRPQIMIDEIDVKPIGLADLF